MKTYYYDGTAGIGGYTGKPLGAVIAVEAGNPLPPGNWARVSRAQITTWYGKDFFVSSHGFVHSAWEEEPYEESIYA